MKRQYGEDRESEFLVIQIFPGFLKNPPVNCWDYMVFQPMMEKSDHILSICLQQSIYVISGVQDGVVKSELILHQV